MATGDDDVGPDRGAAWKPDALLKGLLIWTSLLTGLIAWLPFMRATIEGQAYKWVFGGGIGGRGTAGDYWLLVSAGLFSATLLYAGWRGARQPFHWLLLFLHGSLAVAVTYAAVRAPEQLVFEGATWGIQFSFATIGPALFWGVFASAAFWVIRDVRQHRQRSSPSWVWTRANRVRLGLVLAIVPTQIILLRTWGPFSVGAMCGVALTIWQWFMMTYRLIEPVTPRSRDPISAV